MGLSNELSCGARVSPTAATPPPRCFQSEVLRLYIPELEPRVVRSNSPVVPVYLHANVGPPDPPATVLDGSSCGHVACPSCPANALPRVLSAQLRVSAPLPVWVNVSSLTLWLSDFHTIQFSVSSGCFLMCCCPFGCARRHSVLPMPPLDWKSPKCNTFLYIDYVFCRFTEFILIVFWWTCFLYIVLCHLQVRRVSLPPFWFGCCLSVMARTSGTVVE